MTKRVASVVLVLSLVGSVLAGLPMHSGSGESGMMDCCKKAMEQSNSRHVAAARLCCAMNCNEPGSPSGNTSQAFFETGSEPTPILTVALPPASLSKLSRTRDTARNSIHAKPAYIHNLALLI